MSFIYYKNDFLRIIDFNSNHLTEKYVGWLNNQEIVKFSEQRHIDHSLESCKEYFDENQQSNNLFLAIEYLDKETNEYIHIGNIGVNKDSKNKYADISIIIGEKNYWGEGIGFFGIKGVVSYLFNNEGLHLITCGTTSENTGMVKLMEKLKMNPKVTLKERFFVENKWCDLIQGYLINPYH